MESPKISVVIPVWNEADSIAELSRELSQTLSETRVGYEVIFINDGSTDGTRDALINAQRKDPSIRWVELRNHFGKSAALSAGFETARGSIIVTMDGDLQDNPSEIPAFIDKLNDGYDVVSGWKNKRKDSLTRIVLSKIYNSVTSQVSGIHLHDFNCGFKAYRKSVIEEIHIYGELHRYIPLLASWRGFKIAEISVAHRARKYGRSKYGVDRLLSGLLDLVTVTFLTHFTKKPSHFFGTIGLGIAGLGMTINGYIAYLRIAHGNIQSRHPLLFLGVLLTIVGVQFFSTGLLAELITFGQKKNEKEFSVKEYSIRQ